MKLLDKYIHLFGSALFIAFGCLSAWFLDVSHPLAFIVIGFLGGDIYRQFKIEVER